MSDEYVPTTERVRNAYSDAWVGDGSHADIDAERWENAQDFDRWLAAHDAELLADTPETVEVVAFALQPRLDEYPYTEGDRERYRGYARTVLAALREHLTPALPNEGKD